MTNVFTDDDVARLRTVFLRMSRDLDRQSASGGLTRTQLSVLTSTGRLGPIAVTELAEVEGINPTMLSRIIAKLGEAGLVDRESDPNDRRIVRISVTEGGRRLHDRLRAERSQLLVDRIAGLAPGDAMELLQALPSLEALARISYGAPIRAGR